MRLRRGPDGRALDGGDLPAVEGRSVRWWMWRGRLHRADGPAVVSAGGTRLWYWRGVRVPRHVIERPRDVSITDILKERDVEVRRAWIEAWGLAEGLQELRRLGKARLLDETRVPPRRLWEITAIQDVDERHPVYVEVTCPSTGRVYHLRIHPDQKRCLAAVASTFPGVSEEVYARAVET